jgi:uracil-DNA glycosylase family 4
LSEINNCRCFLDKQIEIINPKILFLLGSVASRTILGMSVTTARGRWHQYKDKMVLCSYHPAFILRQDQDKSQFYKKQVWEDIKILMSRVS